ncbi:hypothetical protein [Ruegeria atlantica]|uniref:hypothetical protein n=1 Tax=Ruegeria atlantica TaxID=81569 RepID=UPI001479B4D6|nr:hypothetical protein [Ruegeria atlantica]
MDKKAETLGPTVRDKDRIKDASPTKTVPLDAHVSVDQTYTLAKIGVAHFKTDDGQKC